MDPTRASETGEQPDRPAGPPELTDGQDLEALRARVREHVRARNRAAGIPMCRRCGTPLHPRDDELVHVGWCYSDSSAWLEARIIDPLVKALGHRRARQALVRLVKRSQR